MWRRFGSSAHQRGDLSASGFNALQTASTATVAYGPGFAVTKRAADVYTALSALLCAIAVIALVRGWPWPIATAYGVLTVRWFGFAAQYWRGEKPPPRLSVSEDQAGLLELTRRGGAWRDQFRYYRVFLDNVQVGRIWQGGTWKAAVDPGRHRLVLKLDWCRSRSIDFDVTLNGTAGFVCGPSRDGILASFYEPIFRSSTYIDLRAETRPSP